MKLIKTFRAVPPGQIYPVDYQPGDECPAEYEQSAREQCCLEPAPESPPAEGEATAAPKTSRAATKK